MKLDHDEYAEASAQRELAEDADISEQGIDIVRRDGMVVLRGHVENDQRRETIATRVAAHFPNCTIQNDITVVRATPPADAEALR